ncbi:dynein heavy chain-like protein 2 [Mercenaria mercenaria]|uniref:dynein heavy chain-like protein 2 n=1 Tax=Mercenaria mercenaria TaxID=6596 RepID=UPI00234F34D9|nr:dynein heavy chain-like protein 2 [Mercenaria mercenaria]XP_053388305.1 dynein heavy chain-like protein 2 [Mercenaria mercenaria]
MDHRAQLENKKYRNWVRAGLGFKYVKDGLEPFCDHLVNQQHVDIIDKVKQKHNLSAVACRLCDVRTLQPDHVQAKNRLCPLGQTHCNCLHPRGKTSCTNNVCGAIYDEIIRRHASTPPAPYWRNTDAHQWCTEPWAVAKCFINVPGYEQKTRATDFDCSGLLHLLINNLEFHHHIQCIIDGNDAFSRVLQHRNAIFHCNNMEVEDTDIANYIDDMIELLQDDKEFKDRQESKNAVKKLLELKQEKFVITTTDEMEVRRNAMDAIEEKEKNLEQRIVDAATEIGESEKQIKVIGSTIKHELAQKRVEMKDDLRKTEIDSIGRLEKKEKEIKEVLRMKEIESVKKMDQKERESKDNLRKIEVDLKQKLEQKELQIKKNLRVTEVNSKEGLKHEEIEIKKNLRVVELESKGRLDQKGKEIEKHLERKGKDILYQLDRKQLAQIQIEARRRDDISKVILSK